MCKPDPKDKKVKITDYKDGSGSKIDIYDKDPYGNNDHDSIHIKVNYEKETWSSTEKIDGKKEESSGNCYLTTACMMNSQKPFNDNCYELTVLRWFRDNYVSKEDTEYYYKTAPAVVEKIKASKNNDIVYDYIYENVVSACVEDIEHSDYESAYDRYKDSVLKLAKTFN